MPSNPALTFAPGAVVGGRYRLDALIGQGGFGVVFRATEIARDHTVAVKILLPDLLNDEGLARFDREAEIVRRLDHPNVVRLLDFGRAADGSPFLVFEHLRGQTLDATVQTGGAMPPARVARIASQILKALMQAHEAGIVHRDLKPANVFLCEFHGERDYVKVLDFGIAKAGDSRTLTQRGATVGTPAYMAPEQLMGAEAEPASDLYALGLMVAEALAGRRLFEDRPLGEIVHAQTSPDPVPLPPEARRSPLGPWIDRAIEKRLERRFASAAAMLAALDAIPLDAAGVAPAPAEALGIGYAATSLHTGRLVPTPPPRADARRRRPWARAAVIVAAATACAAIAVAVIVSGRGSGRGGAGTDDPSGAWRTSLEDGVAEALVNGDAIPDLVGVHADPDPRLCAFDGATLRPIWCVPVRATGAEPHRVMVAPAGRRLVHADPAGVAYLHDLATGRELAAFPLGSRVEVMCADPDAPAKLWLKTVRQRGFALDTAAKRLTAGAPRPASCAERRGETGCGSDPPPPTCPADRPGTLLAISGIRVTDVVLANGDAVGVGDKAPSLGVPLLFGYRTDDPSPTTVRWRHPLVQGQDGPGTTYRPGFMAMAHGRAVVAYEDASHAKRLLAAGVRDGRTLWDVVTGEVDRLALGTTRVYVQRRARLEVRDAADGRLIGGIGAR